MDRHLDSSGAASAPTVPANVMGPNVYPQGGVSPSLPGPWWFHMVTEEMRAAIAVAGLTPDRANVTQLSDAILTRALDVTTKYRQAALAGCAVMIEI